MSDMINALIARGHPIDIGGDYVRNRNANRALDQRDVALAQDQQQIDYRNALMQRQQDQQDEEAQREAAWVAAIKEGDAIIAAQGWNAPGAYDKAFQLDPEHTAAYAQAKLKLRDAQNPVAPGAGLGNVNPGDYTPESMQQYVGSIDPKTGRGNFGLLQRYVTPAQDKVVVIGGVPSMVDPRSHDVTPLSTLPDETAGQGAIAGAKEGATIGAKNQAQAASDLPRVELNAQGMLDTLDQLDKAPGLRYIVGAASLAPVIPGTSQADAYAIWEQVQGKAFLEAYNTLKGGGQITEVEGKKATSAITRLSNRQQSVAGFKAAIRDLRSVIKAGLDRQRQKAGQKAGKTVVRTGTLDGRKVVQYSDGTVEYGN